MPHWVACVAEAIRDVSADVATFRKWAGYNDPAFNSDDANASVRLSWRAAWPKSAEAFFSMLESLAFGTYYDMHVRDAVKERKDVQSFFAVQNMEELLLDVDHLLKSEAEGESTGAAQACAAEEEADEAEPKELTLDAHPKVVELSKGLDDAAETKLQHFKNLARKLVHTHVDVIAETDADDLIVSKIQETQAGKFRGDAAAKTYCGIFYDPKHAGPPGN